MLAVASHFLPHGVSFRTKLTYGSLTYSLSKRLSGLYVSSAVGVLIPSERHMLLYDTSLSTVPTRSVIKNSNKIS
jgi:hypothetical protein